MSLEAFLQTASFPPAGPLPASTEADIPYLLSVAKGKPGQVVWPGLFPRTPAKLARMLLAARGFFDADDLLRVASTQYGGDLPIVSKETRRYDAHDAFACAMIHPHTSAQDRAALVQSVLAWSAQQRHRGWRSRRKSWEVARWAVRIGAVDPSLLPVEMAKRLAWESAPDHASECPAHPEGPMGALDCFAARWPRFRSHLQRERSCGRWLDYVGIAELGHRHFAAFASGCRQPFVQGVFDAIEHVLTFGDDAAQNLVVVGLFEAVQNDAYRAGAVGDAYEAALQTHSRAAWANLIEGWTGPGIRDLSAWRSKAKRQQ